MSKLTKKRQVWLIEYFKCWNATEAARRAGFKHPNMAGPRLMVNDGIQEAIKEKLSELTLSADEILVRLAEQARGEAGKYLTSHGTIDFEQLIQDEKQHLIKSIKETKYGLDIEFYDAQSALVHLGKHRKLFTEQLDINIEGIDDAIERELARLAGRSEDPAV